MARIKQDGTFNTAVACGSPVYSTPFPETNEPYVLVQPFMMDGFSKATLGAAHATLTDYKLVSETDHESLGNGIMKWKRTYAKVPATRYTPEPFVYPFIGFYGLAGINVSGVTGREREVKSCMSRIRHEYFLVGAGQTYTTPEAIPIVWATKYYIGDESLLVNYLADSPPFVTATTPSRTTYEGWVAAAITDEWAATNQIVASDSTLEEWLGPIWCRSTRYILPQ